MANRMIEQSKVIVTAGNLALPEAGQVLWDCPNCADMALVLGGRPGQPVAYTLIEDENDPNFGMYVTVDHTGDGTNPLADIYGDIYVGQFTNCSGKSYADDIRTIGGRSLGKCDLDSVKTVAPTCPQPQILASYLDCFECGDTITAHFKYSDNATQSFGSLRNDSEETVCSATIDCCGTACHDCDPQATCDVWIAELVDALNGDKGNDKSKFYPDRKPKKAGSKDYPFRFFKLQKNIFTYCIAPTKDDCGCESCVETAAITGITGGLAVGADAATFTNNQVPSQADPATMVTHMDMLDNIAKQIECAYKQECGNHAATAFVTGGTDDCCPAQLWVMTCDPDFALNIEPCDTGIEAFEAFTDKGKTVGRDCETGDCVKPVDAEKEFCCGIGVIIDQDRIECDCPCDVEVPPATLLRTGKFQFLKNAQDCSPKVRSRELLCPKAPSGSGGEVRWAEYSQSSTGECWRDTSERQGTLGSLRGDKVGRMKNAPKFSKCDQQYCHYQWINKKEHINCDKVKVICHNKTDWYIPTCDLVTIDSFTLFYTALAETSSGRCHKVKVGPCVGHGEETLVEAPELDCDGTIVEEGEKKEAAKEAPIELVAEKKTTKKKK